MTTYDVQLTVIKHKKKTYISHLAAIALNLNLENSSIITFGNKSLIEVKAKDKHMISDLPVYDMDSAIRFFKDIDEEVEEHEVPKSDCFEFDGMSYIPLSKIKVKNKYHLRFSLPTVKIFGAYYIVCNKQKDVNTRVVLINK